jgi:hypothetical protein
MRRLLIGVLALLALIAGADALWWYSAVRQLNKGLAAQVQMARNAGWSVAASTPVRGGWPFAASLTLGDLVVAGPGVAWSADHLVLQLNAWHPLLLLIEAEGTQHLQLGTSPDMPFTADTLRASVPLQAGVPPRGFALHIINLRAGLGEGPSASLTVGSLDMQTHWTPAAQQNEAAISASVRAANVRLPTLPDAAWPFGNAVAHITTDLVLDGPLPRVKDLAERAVAWRDAGGTLQVQHLVLTWGALDISGGATLALDDQLQPMGAGTVRITDPNAALDSLRDSGFLGDRAAFAAKALLALLLKPPPEGEPPAVELPLTLQDRRLSISRYGVTRLPRLALP